MNNGMMIQKVLISMLRKAFEIEENGSAVIMKMYLYEESKERKRILHNLLRDTEHHRIMISDLLKDLGGEKPSRLSEIRDYDFEEMFIDQKLNILRRIEESSRDFYRGILEDIRESEGELGNALYRKTVSILEDLVAWEEDHVDLVEKLKDISLK